MRTRTALVAIAALVSGACSDDVTTPIEPQLAVAEEATGPAASASYRVTILNLSGGQPFTPPLAAVHRRPLALFEAGQPASSQLRQIAENGNLGPMTTLLGADGHVADLVVAEGPTLPPLLPGEQVSFTVTGERGARYLSVVSMLICTNDGFTGLAGHRLPMAVGDVAASDLMAYDAGTEVNTEDFADLVPPCPALTGVPSSDPGTGTSDPALAEGGVVHRHAGVSGSDDLDAGLHGWAGPVGRIEVERIG